MRIPKTLKIGGRKIQVRCVTSREIDGAATYKPYYQLIRINIDDTSEDKQAEALLHEILEFINADQDLELDHKTLCVLGAWLFAAIRQNKLTFLET